MWRHMTRAQIQQEFVAAFSEGEPAILATASDLATMEQELGTSLPQSYVAFMQTHGAIRTPSMLKLVVDTESDLWALEDFITPGEAIRDTKLYWSGGMSAELVGFAGDGMGNLFCFRRLRTGAPRPDDVPVCFFDHEFPDANSELAKSFDEWLASYLKLGRRSAV
jgi:hypothetical protein